jgi:CubicO group peptidase (beta-lactamase class C family)
MRLARTALIMTLIVAPAAGADAQIERTIARQVRAIVPADGAGGVAVALRIAGRTLFFNYGWADRSAQRPITADTLFNLASLRKVRRAVQGYAEDGTPLGEPGSRESYYHWPGTGQMYSSPRDMAIFLAANLGELPIEQTVLEAMTSAQQGMVTIGPHSRQALAWEVSFADAPTIVEKYGGLQNASAYIGVMPRHKLGIVILGNRGNQYPNEVGRRIMLALATPRRRRP